MTQETGMKFLTIVAIALTLAACGSKESNEPAKREPTDQAMQQKQKIDEALEAADGQ
jgi:outer membrane biogenesis lipoprotein LolB